MKFFALLLALLLALPAPLLAEIGGGFSFQGGSVSEIINPGSSGTHTLKTGGAHIDLDPGAGDVKIKGVVALTTGSGAPIGATYILQTSNSDLTAEQALSALASGIMRVATTTGVITSLTTSADIAANISDETGTLLLVFSDAPTFTTNITTPIILGGSAAGSSQTIQSTSGVGTTDFVRLLVGDNGATQAMRVLTDGEIIFGTATVAQGVNWTFRKDQNADTSIYGPRNVTSGGAAAASLYVLASSNQLALRSFSVAFTTAGRNVADGGLVDHGGPGGLGISASNATGIIQFWTAGNNERGRITAGWAVGAAPTGGDQGVGTVNVDTNYYADGTAGVAGPVTCTTVTSITVKMGIVTAIAGAGC